MITMEGQLIEELSREKHPHKMFFSYANTVATIDFAKQFKGHGWVGIRYQIEPDEDYNEIILHIRFKETDADCNKKRYSWSQFNLWCLL
jgi:hypothetical protein